MKLSLHWLADYVDTAPLTAQQIAAGLTLSGSKAETVTAQADALANIVVGRVLAVERHPDADRLSVCRVDVGRELTVVTAATNVVANATVPVALEGAVLPDGKVITPGKLRGVMSEGMFCSFAELGLQHEDVPYADADGILLLPEPFEPGTPIAAAMGLDDTTIEFEITNNRPDCLSVRGLAREAAATFGVPLRLPEPQTIAGQGNIQDLLTITIEDAALCPRYCARMVQDVVIAPSPRWLRDRLRASGLRPINNIVDITNYVMLEYGQPMHAFDYACVGDKTITVRTAREGETLETLDGKQHALLPSMLLIADKSRPIGVAGVMGGANSEITEKTSTIVFESATFHGGSVRKTAQALGMRTDASARFEKGLDPLNTIPAVERACQLVEQLGCGTVVGGLADVCHADVSLRTMALDCDAINRLLGTAYSQSDIVASLTALGFGVDGTTVTIPSWRADVSITADLAEEVARLKDYNTIPRTLNPSAQIGRLTDTQQALRKLNSLCRALGYSEMLTYSFYGDAALDQLNLPADAPERNAVTLLNPLGEDTALMKTTHLSSVLEGLCRNDSLSAADCALFMVEHVFIKAADSVLPSEQRRLTLGCYGEGHDFFSVKGALDAIFSALNLPEVTYRAADDHPTFHPGRCARLSCGAVDLGILGQLHPSLRERLGLSHDCYLAELNLDAALALALPERKFTPLPRFPSMARDIALVVRNEVTAAQLKEAIVASAGELLTDVAVFDVYTGHPIPAGQKSVAFALTLRAVNRTLTDEEADAVIAKVLAHVASAHGAVLRA